MKNQLLLFLSAGICLSAVAMHRQLPEPPKMLNQPAGIVPAKASGTSYDVKVSFPDALPSFLPKLLVDGMPINAQVTNLGSETVSGNVTFTLGDANIGTAEFSNIASGDSIEVSVTLTNEIELPTVKSSFEANATLTGVEDEDPSDNVASEPVTITEHEFAYDHVTPAMYVDKYALGYDDISDMSLYAVSFHVPNAVMLDSISASFGKNEGESSGVYIYKWDAKSEPAAIENNIAEYKMDERTGFETFKRGEGRGMHYYPLQEPLYLEPGDYMVSVSFNGRGISTDLTMPNQMYFLYATTEGIHALDWSNYRLGTPGIRTYVSYASPSGVSTPQLGDNGSGATISVTGTELSVETVSTEIKDITVYSTSGAAVFHVKAGGQHYKCNLSVLNPGIYIAKVNTDNGTCAQKFVIR